MTTARSVDDPSVLDTLVVANALGAHLVHGLTTAEAARRLAEDGPNELRAVAPRSAWRRLLAHFQDPLMTY